MSDFDRERFEQLAQKAENNNITKEEAEELREQIDALNGVLHDFAGCLVDILQPAMEHLTAAFEPLAKYSEEIDNEQLDQ